MITSICYIGGFEASQTHASGNYYHVTAKLIQPPLGKPGYGPELDNAELRLDCAENELNHACMLSMYVNEV